MEVERSTEFRRRQAKGKEWPLFIAENLLMLHLAWLASNDTLITVLCLTIQPCCHCESFYETRLTQCRCKSGRTNIPEVGRKGNNMVRTATWTAEVEQEVPVMQNEHQELSGPTLN